MKFPNFPFKDRKKACRLVNDIISSDGDFVCLSCGKKVDCYRNLVSHKKKCCEERVLLVGADMETERKGPKLEVDEPVADQQLFHYITGNYLVIDYLGRLRISTNLRSNAVTTQECS